MNKKLIAGIGGVLIIGGIITTWVFSSNENELVGKWTTDQCGVKAMDIKEDMTADFNYHGDIIPGKLEKQGDDLYRFNGGKVWIFRVNIEDDMMTAVYHNGVTCKYKRSE